MSDESIRVFVVLITVPSGRTRATAPGITKTRSELDSGTGEGETAGDGEATGLGEALVAVGFGATAGLPQADSKAIPATATASEFR
jgi:hypothetical protein